MMRRPQYFYFSRKCFIYLVRGSIHSSVHHAMHPPPWSNPYVSPYQTNSSNEELKPNCNSALARQLYERVQCWQSLYYLVFIRGDHLIGKWKITNSEKTLRAKTFIFFLNLFEPVASVLTYYPFVTVETWRAVYTPMCLH